MIGPPCPQTPDVVERPSKRARQSSSPPLEDALQQRDNPGLYVGDAIVTHQDNCSHSSTTSTQTLTQSSPRPPTDPPTAASLGHESLHLEDTCLGSRNVALPDPSSSHLSLAQGQEPSASRFEEEEELAAKTPESVGEEVEFGSGERQELEAKSSADESQHSESQKSDSSVMVGTPLQMRWMLKQKKLYIDYEHAREKGGRLIAKATSILDDKRQSDWSHDQRAEVAQSIKKYGEENELTFVVNFMGWILGKTRKIPPTNLSGAELQEEREWIDAKWEKDHLHTRWNVDFIPNCIPAIRSGNTYMDKLIDQVPRVKKPKPDIAWGLYEDAFTEGERMILENQKNHLVGLGMYDVFFVLEAKSINASLEEAENQCMRSGCAMVNTRRVLNNAATLQQAPRQ